VPTSVSKKFNALRQCGYNWFGEPINPEAILRIKTTLAEVTQKILREMDNPKRKFGLPSPSNDDLSPLATDQLNALILWLLRRGFCLGHSLGQLLE